MKIWEVQKDTKCDENMEVIQIQDKIISNRVFFIEYALSWYGLPINSWNYYIQYRGSMKIRLSMHSLTS